MSASDYDYDGRFVCAECFGDEGIRNFIENSVEGPTCSFCNTEAKIPIAAKFKNVAAHINKSLYKEYDLAENWLMYIGEEGGFQGTTWDTFDLLTDVLSLELPRDKSGDLLDAICSRVNDNTWCEADPYGLSYADETHFSWERFCKVVKHQRRFFFSEKQKRENEDILSPAELLERILDYARKVGLFLSYDPNNLVLIRARHQSEGKKWTTPEHLGPPPVQKATQSNRMSPAGVVMFYASDSVETCLRETAMSGGDGSYALGTFVNKRPAVILNLADLPSIPSLFAEIPDGLDYNPRPVLQFLHHVSLEISQPVHKDGREHIEYVPSQVVTEFVRVYGGIEEKVDGIRYSSAVHEGKVSYVLFADQDNLVLIDPQPAQKDRWLELMKHEEQILTKETISGWKAKYAVHDADLSMLGAT